MLLLLLLLVGYILIISHSTSMAEGKKKHVFDKVRVEPRFLSCDAPSFGHSATWLGVKFHPWLWFIIIVRVPNRLRRAWTRTTQVLGVKDLTSPDREGFLTKQGGSVKTMKKRWFVLKGDTLYYFKTKTVRNFLACISRYNLVLPASRSRSLSLSLLPSFLPLWVGYIFITVHGVLVIILFRTQVSLCD